MAHDSKPFEFRPALPEQLKAKSRSRRGSVKRVSDAEQRISASRNDLTPQLKLATRSIADLAVPARNVRSLDPAHVRAVAASIAHLGFTVPVLIDQNNGVLDGHVRVEAGRSLGLTTIPCIVAAHLSATERRLLRIAVNRLQEKGEWDLGSLKLEFDELILEEAPIEITGFSGTEIDQIILGDEAEAFEEGQLTPAADAIAVARPGDVFLLGGHQIICGDATDPAVLARLRVPRPPGWC